MTVIKRLFAVTLGEALVFGVFLYGLSRLALWAWASIAAVF